MNPDYLWLTGAIQLLTIFVVGPLVGSAIAYAAWRGKPQGFRAEHYVVAWIASGAAVLLLFGFAKHLNADVRTAQYFLQLSCVLLGGVLFGAFMGSGLAVVLHAWRWHKKTRAMNHNQTEQ